MTTTVTFDHSSWETIKRLLDEMASFRAKYPEDYKYRIGWSYRAEEIIELLARRG